MAHFYRDEYDRRLVATTAAMAGQGIDVLLATNPANMAWLTGYDGWSFYVHQLVIVAGELAEPVWIGRGMDANAARVTTILGDDSIRGYPDDYVQSTVKHPMQYVAGVLKEKGLDRGTIGVEKDAYYFTARCLEVLQAELPEARFEDATTLTGWCRVVKSDAEIALMRQAAPIVENMMQAGIDHIEPGTRQCDAVAAIYHAMVTGTPEAGGDYSAIVPMLPTGRGTSTPHLTWSDEPFRAGEATLLELGGVRLRYHCPLARTVHLGKPPPKLADAARIAVEGLEKAIEAARPGNRAEDIEAAWRGHVEKHGIVKESRLGYSIGLAYPPDWGEGTVSLRPGDRTELRPNMCFHIMPGIWQDDWGLEITEPVRITDGAAETFCSFRRELIVKD